MSIAPRKLKSGKTVYDVCVYVGFTADGRRDRRKVTCRTKRAAEVEHAKLVSMADAMRGRSGRMSLSDYIEGRWWPDASRRLQALTLDKYEREVRLRISPLLGRLDMRDIDHRRIQAAVDGLPTLDVARNFLCVLRAILGSAEMDGLLQTNPAKGSYNMPQKGRSRDNGLVLSDFGEILGLLDIVRLRASESVQRIAYTGLLQGLRPEERYALDWADVDAQRGLITVRSAYVRASKAHGGLQTKPTKTHGSARDIPMMPQFAEWLGTQRHTDGPFITGASGRRISPTSAQQRWAAFLRGNPDAPPVTIENMRHSFATAYLAAGGRVEALSRILGHSSIMTTYRRYVRPDSESVRADIERLSMC